MLIICDEIENTGHNMETIIKMIQKTRRHNENHLNTRLLLMLDLLCVGQVN